MFIQDKKQVVQGKMTVFEINYDGMMEFKGRVCVPKDSNLSNLTLTEVHKSKLSTHPEATKMYRDLKLLCWWPGMKKDIVRYISSFLTCQKVEVAPDMEVGMCDHGFCNGAP